MKVPERERERGRRGEGTPVIQVERAGVVQVERTRDSSRKSQRFRQTKREREPDSCREIQVEKDREPPKRSLKVELEWINPSSSIKRTLIGTLQSETTELNIAEAFCSWVECALFCG